MRVIFILLSFIGLLNCLSAPAYAYVDPGTGSMLLSFVLSIISTLFFVFHLLMIKLKSLFFLKNKKDTKHHYSIVLYSEGKQYWKIFKPILDEFEKREYKVTFLTGAEDDYIFEENYKHVSAKYIGKGYAGMTKMAFLNADICLMTTPQLDVLQLKRSKFCKHYIHIFHAISCVASEYHLFSLDYYDAVLCDGEFQIPDIRKMEAKRNLPAKELVVTGSAYMDYLNNQVKDSNIKKNEATILLAPSWGPDGLLRKYGTELIDKILKNDYNIIIRPHPQSLLVERKIINKIIDKYSHNDKIVFDFDADNLKSMAQADILISDFSGIMFEYAFLFNRPFLYINKEMNHEIYDYSEFEEIPKRYKNIKEIGIELNDENILYIDSILEKIRNDKDILNNISIAKDIFWQKRNEAAKNIVDYLIQKQKEFTQC